MVAVGSTLVSAGLSLAYVHYGIPHKPHPSSQPSHPSTPLPDSPLSSELPSNPYSNFNKQHHEVTSRCDYGPLWECIVNGNGGCEDLEEDLRDCLKRAETILDKASHSRSLWLVVSPTPQAVFLQGSLAKTWHSGSCSQLWTSRSRRRLYRTFKQQSSPTAVCSLANSRRLGFTLLPDEVARKVQVMINDWWRSRGCSRTLPFLLDGGCNHRVMRAPHWVHQ